MCTKPTNDEELLELVQLQKHVHSKSCLRYGSCRFGIPKMPRPQTWNQKQIISQKLSVQPKGYSVKYKRK